MGLIELLRVTETPTKESGIITWVLFLAEKYWSIFVSATLITLCVAVVGTLLGYLVGFFVGVVNTTTIHPEDNPVKKIIFKIFKVIIAVYVEVFRDTPMIVQGMVIYYGLRQSDIMITSIAAGILVTLLNTGAYMGETVRGGINSVDCGQEERAFPEMCNTFLNNMKMTSVLNVIGVSELFLSAKTAGGTYYKYFEAYIVIAVIYLVLCFVFNRIFLWLEKKMEGRKDYELATEYMENE